MRPGPALGVTVTVDEPGPLVVAGASIRIQGALDCAFQLQPSRVCTGTRVEPPDASNRAPGDPRANVHAAAAWRTSTRPSLTWTVVARGETTGLASAVNVMVAGP